MLPARCHVPTWRCSPSAATPPIRRPPTTGISAELVRWNLDTHDLRDLADRGVPVVTSRFLERGESLALADLLDETGWSEAVIKPCVSGAARHTYRVNHSTAAAVQRVIDPLLKAARRAKVTIWSA